MARWLLDGLEEKGRNGTGPAPEAGASDRSDARERLAKAAENVPGVICSYRLRPDGTACMPFSTPAIEDLYGLSQAELATDMGPWSARVHPEDLQRVADTISQAAGKLSRWHDEFRYLHPTKGERWIEGWSTPVAEPDGSILWHGYVKDVTDRKSEEAARRAAERAFVETVESLQDGFLALDRDWRFTYVNGRAAQNVGLAPKALVGRGLWEQFPMLLGTPAEAAYRRVMEGRAPESLEAKGALSARWYRQSISPAAGGITVIWTDITDRKQAEEAARVQSDELRRANEELREADRRADHFLAVLSHELRNPLSPIRNSVQVLDRAPPGSEAAQRAREVLRRQSEQLTRLVDDLLDFNRIKLGQLELRLERIDAKEVVRGAVLDARDLFELRGRSVGYAESAEPVWVEADAGRLAQMVGNLLSNALKFTKPGDRIHVRVRAQAGQCEVSVRDTGLGIAPADLQRIFEPFIQAGRTRHASTGGLGLGLALVRELVQKHGGTARALSEGPGQGAEVLLAIPLAPALAAARSTAADGPGATGLSILIVEDNEDAGVSLADLLSLDGHSPTLESTGRAGLETALRDSPDVLICDLGLPDQSGLEMIRSLRSALQGRPLFAIAFTGYADPRDRQLALDAGFDAHLPKPPPIDALHRLLAFAARQRSGGRSAAGHQQTLSPGVE